HRDPAEGPGRAHQAPQRRRRQGQCRQARREQLSMPVQFGRSGDTVQVKGRLTFDSAGEALAASQGLFSRKKKLTLDLAGVEATDSAGLALLVEWVGEAKRAGCKLKFSHVPKQALALARISEVEKLLPLR